MQSESGIVGRTIGGRRPEELLVVLGVVEIVLAAEDVAGFGAGHFAVELGFGTGIQRTGVVVANESEGPQAGLMVAGHCEIEVALIDGAAFALSVAVVTLVLVEDCKNMGHTLCP